MVDPKELDEALKMVADETSKELEPAVNAVVDNMLNKQMFPMDAMGMDHKIVEATYMQAVHLYNTAQYIESAKAFHALVLLHPAEVKFYIGLAASYHMVEEYDGALTIYGYIGVLDPESPVPHYHASDCYLKMDMTSPAIAELQIAMQLCGDQAQYAMIKDRCQITINALQEQANTSAAPNVSSGPPPTISAAPLTKSSAPSMAPKPPTIKVAPPGIKKK